MLDIFRTRSLRNRTFIMSFAWWVDIGIKILSDPSVKTPLLLCRQVWNKSGVLWAESERGQLRLGHLPDTVNLRRGGNSRSSRFFATSPVFGQEKRPSRGPVYWGLCLSGNTRDSKRYLIMNDLESVFNLQVHSDSPEHKEILWHYLHLILTHLPQKCLLFCPSDLPVVVTVIAVLGKFAATSSFCCVYVYTAELYPTTLR